jgi:hypothetical protein
MNIIIIYLIMKILSKSLIRLLVKEEINLYSPLDLIQLKFLIAIFTSIIMLKEFLINYCLFLNQEII